MSLTKSLAIALIVPALLAGAGCKKKPPAPPPPPPQPVEVRLQVTSISPSTIAPKTPTPAKVYGSAFEDGATVTFTGPMELRGQEVAVDSGNTMSLTIPGLVDGTYDVKVANPDGTSSVLRSGLTVKSMEIACRNVTVNFDYDQAGLRNDAKSALDGNMSCFQSLTGQIAIEGHADERGTVDYNLALGQRRADTVKRYMVNSGVATGRISTTTYGEERPVDRGHNEVAWGRNRRAEIIATE
jgi:outer membrane protein OmpA-like peptidoglycan-associated protein